MAQDGQLWPSVANYGLLRTSLASVANYGSLWPNMARINSSVSFFCLEIEIETMNTQKQIEFI
jgi:hypothetical protein